jgi:5'-nucleotidase
MGCATRSSAPPTAAAPPGLVDVQLLAFNDLHGTLEPATGGNGRIGTTDAGGIEFFATHLQRLRAQNPNTIVVSAGDNIGASTLLSGMFHDEPTIEALNQAGLDISTVGNHEFDEGWAELYRMQKGGCHPVDGCQDKTPFNGAKFTFLSANVVVDPARVDPQLLARSGWRPAAPGPQTLFPSFTVKEIGGTKIGFIGLVVQSTPDIVAPAGVRGVTFRPEAEAGNEAVTALERQGVKAIVVLIHEGGTPATTDVNGCDVTGPIVNIVNSLSDDVDVVISGHTHHSYVCTMGHKLVTSAESLGRLITDVDLKVDRTTGDIVEKSARNIIVTHDVPKDQAEVQLIDHYRPFYTALGDRIVGKVNVPLTRAANKAGESALGDVVADAFLEGALAVDPKTVAAFVNPGSIRADLVGDAPAGAAPRQVRFAQGFDTLPFANRVVVRTLTGEALRRMFEQQFDNPEPPSAKMLQVSRGFTYTFDGSKPAGQRVVPGSMAIDGHPIEPTGRYRIASSDFVWGGGDAFMAAKEATDPADAGVDADILVAYLMKHSPVAPGPQDRVHSR